MPLVPKEVKKKRKNNSAIFRERDKAFGNENDFRVKFSTEDDVLDFAFRSRAKKTESGCSVCGGSFTFFQKVFGRKAYQCRCKKSPMIFPLSGTPFERLKVPLTAIPKVFYEMFCDKHGFTATEIDRRFSDLVKKNETSHLLLSRISQTMGLATQNREFDPDAVIEVDEVYPKVETGLGPYHDFKRGLGSERIQPLIILTQRAKMGMGGITKAFAVEEVNNKVLREIFRKHTKDTNIIHTDGSNVYNFLKFDEEFKSYFKYECNHRTKEWVRENSHVNTVEGCNSFIKTIIHRVAHGIKRDNAQLYANRVVFNYSFWDKDALTAFEILFDSLPPLNEKISDRVTCNRTKKSCKSKNVGKWSKAA